MRRQLPVRLLMLAALVVLPAGCDDSGGTPAADLAVNSTPQDSAVAPSPDLVVLPPDLGCWPTPMSHLEILNACTSAQAVDKVPVTPRLNADGTLPPLP